MSSRASLFSENKELLKDICESLSGKYEIEVFDIPNHCCAANIKEKSCKPDEIHEFIKEYVSKMTSINSSLKLVQFMADQYSKEKGDLGKHVRECESIEEFAKFMKLMIDTVIKQTELGGE